ncbi:MAG: hypothetical protein AAB757_02330 [Patescibacteria group bacterium]
MKKSLVIIGFLILVAGLIGGIWYWQKNKVVNNQPIVVNQQTASTTSQEVSQNSTSTWLTYKNDKYGFEFQYPSEFHLIEKKSNYILNKDTINEKVYQAIEIGLSSKDTSNIRMGIRIVLNNNQNLNQAALNDIDMISQNAELGMDTNFDPKTIVTSTEIIGGLNAERILFNTYIKEGVIIKDNSNLYIINQSGMNNFNQILSTFKFTK